MPMHFIESSGIMYNAFRIYLTIRIMTYIHIREF
jgi:hypothetical protein